MIVWWQVDNTFQLRSYVFINYRELFLLSRVKKRCLLDQFKTMPVNRVQAIAPHQQILPAICVWSLRAELPHQLPRRGWRLRQHFLAL
jgi:hypothetical protein